MLHNRSCNNICNLNDITMPAVHEVKIVFTEKIVFRPVVDDVFLIPPLKFG